MLLCRWPAERANDSSAAIPIINKLERLKTSYAVVLSPSFLVGHHRTGYYGTIEWAERLAPVEYTGIHHRREGQPVSNRRKRQGCIIRFKTGWSRSPEGHNPVSPLLSARTYGTALRGKQSRLLLVPDSVTLRQGARSPFRSTFVALFGIRRFSPRVSPVGRSTISMRGDPPDGGHDRCTSLTSRLVDNGR